MAIFASASTCDAIRQVSSRHHWFERAAAWRQHLSALACDAVAETKTKNATLWSSQSALPRAGHDTQRRPRHLAACLLSRNNPVATERGIYPRSIVRITENVPRPQSSILTVRFHPVTHESTNQCALFQGRGKSPMVKPQYNRQGRLSTVWPVRNLTMFQNGMFRSATVSTNPRLRTT